MLILQGTEDKVVPPSQAVQMADAVRATGRPVALVMLEGEGHGFRAMATRRLALEAQVSFLEQVFGMPPSPDVPVLEIENL
ncbi:prolyl oligopeptidase family serine peptidase [Tessaracoccus sp. HDW20]|nr:prolyl oligopeptidase family serine peptidase [Tessaracoccus coleopterorum]